MDFKIQNPSPALQFRSSHTKRSQTRQIVVHHIDHATASIHDVHGWHLNRDFAGIGYNFFVDKKGNIFNGRGMTAVGAHTNPPAGVNSASVGISCQGAYDTVDKTMPDAQFNALVWLLLEIRRTYGDIPIVGHGELVATACPGRYFPIAEVRTLKFRGVAEKEEDVMTQERFNQMMDNYLAEKNLLPSSEWSSQTGEFQAAIDAGITDGTAPQRFVTREQAAIMALRAKKA